MVTQLQTLLGIEVPMQFEPVLTIVCALIVLFLLSYFAEMLKLIILRR